MCAAKLEHAGFKLSCCDKKLCLFKFNELGLGMSLLAEVKAQPEVVDLLISFAFAACTGQRIHWYFPSPSVQARVVDPVTGVGTDLSFVEEDGEKDLTLFKRVLDLLPSVSELCEHKTDAELKDSLDTSHKLL